MGASELGAMLQEHDQTELRGALQVARLAPDSGVVALKCGTLLALAEEAKELRIQAGHLRVMAENTESLLSHLMSGNLSANKHAMCARLLAQAREVLGE